MHILLLTITLGVTAGLLSGCSQTPTQEQNETAMPGNGYGKTLASGEGVTRGNCLADDCLLVEDLEYPAGELPNEVVTALETALDDEYKALATYEAVMNELGPVRPFSMIKGAEQQHIASLAALFDKYGLEMPENVWIEKVEVPGTLTASCQAGVDAELANAALYRDELLPVVGDYADITMVFENLMNASQEKHLRAFERCN